MGYFRNRSVFLWLSVTCFLNGVLGCAPFQVNKGVFLPSNKNYTINIPENGWEPIRVSNEDIALWHKQHRAMIALISGDVENKDFSLELLNNQLFIGMKGKKILLKETVLVDNQKAIHTVLSGEMDNYKLKINSYVIKIQDQVYDLVCWAPVDSFEYVQDDFDKVVRSFKFLKT